MSDSMPSRENGVPGSEDGTNSDTLTDEEVLVCPSCFRPIDPNAHLCIHCGAPVSATAMIDPLARIWGEGYALRQVTDHSARPNRLVLIGVWLTFGPMALCCVIYLLMMLKGFLEWLVGKSSAYDPLSGSVTYDLWGIVLLTFILALHAAILFRVTQNYCRAIEASEASQDDVEE